MFLKQVLLKPLQRILPSASMMIRPSATSYQTKTPSTTTIDATDIETFSSIASAWWDLKGPMKGLHALNRIRVPFIVEALTDHQKNEVLQNKKVLDIGCGGGVLSEALAKSGATVTGIDATKEVIDIAIQHSKNNKELKIIPSYQCTTIEEHANLYRNHYDCVIASEVIEHVNNQELFIKASVDTLKPGGRIFFTTPSKSRISQLTTIWFGENVMCILPKGTHEYEKFMTPAELESLLKLNGCNVEETRGFMWNMLANKWSWTGTKILFFAIRAVKVNP